VPCSRALAFIAVLAAATPAAAQARPSAIITLPPPVARTTEGPSIALRGAFADKRSREVLASNFPARISVAVELWQSRGLFDDMLNSVSWEFVVRIDPLSNTYRVARVLGDSLVPAGSYPTVDALAAALAQPRAAPITAPTGRRGLYYTVSATIRTLTSNDLAELQRWLSGDVRPALEGRGNPFSVFRTIFSRMLGGDVKRFSAESGEFDT
jgi:hypothetical protein